MNPLLKKEIRLLLPAWIAAMVLAIVPAWIWRLFWMAEAGSDAWQSFNYLLSFDVPLMVAFGILCLGIASFGQEFNSNTFTILLSQPTERRRIWAVKSTMLAIASASVWLVAIVLISWQFDSLGGVEHPHFVSLEISKWEALAFLTVSALAVCSGGLWTTLLLRQIAGAFWVTLIAPVAIVGGIGMVLGFFPISDQIINVVTTIVLLCYSIAGFFLARRLFFQAQDTQWTGGNFLFPWRGKSVEQTASFVRLPRNRFLALTWKEIRLHEVNLFIAAVLLAVHLAAVVLHPMVSNRNTKMILELVWSLWLLMPILIGCAAVAEERKLAVMDLQLCLPVSRRSQFAVKFFVALILSVFLGAVMPSLIERSYDFGTHWYPYWIFPAATAIFFTSFYGSTLSRSTLQAMGVAFVIPIVAWFGLIAFCYLAFHVEILSPNRYFYQGYEGIFRAYLMLTLCLVVFPLALARLMFWNFKWLHQSRKMFRFNFTSILIVFVLLFALTNAIYYRPWELLTPIESPHGPIRLTTETPVQLSFDRGPEDRLIALWPDGRLWREIINVRWRDTSWFDIERWSPYLNSQRVVDGTNWTEMAHSSFYILGLRQNGSLWTMPQVRNRVRMAQIGPDMDWRKIAVNEDGFLLLKKNGTLWLWGTNEPPKAKTYQDRGSAKLKLDLAMPPTRISPETNWSNIVPFAYYRALAQKNDGTFWSWRKAWAPNGGYTNFLVRETNLDNQWSDYRYDWNKSVEIKTNGELWLFEESPKSWDRGGQWVYSSATVPPYTKKIKLDSNHTWKAASFAGYYDTLILLRQDGTLWKWDFSEQKPFRPVQLGHNSDWIALSGDDWMGVALAADGNLWSWADMSDHIWLAPSRKPVYMGNVFEGEGRKE